MGRSSDRSSGTNAIARALIVSLLGLAATSAGVSAEEFAGTVPTAYQARYDALLSNPGDLDALYQLASAADEEVRQTGDVTTARFAIRLYERILLIEPGLTQIALRLGELQYRLGAYVEAGAYFARALQDASLPPALRRDVERYLAEIDRQLSPNRVSGRLTAGLRYQSNPTLGDDDYEFLLFPNPQGADFDIFGGVGITHVFDPGGQRGHMLETTLDASTQQYFELDEISNSAVDLTFGPRFRLDSFGIGGSSIRPFVILDGEWVDGRWYSVNRGLGLQAVAEPTPRWRLTADITAVLQRFNDDLSYGGTIVRSNDGEDYEAGLTAGFRVSPALDLGLSLNWQLTTQDDLPGTGYSEGRHSERQSAEVYARLRHAALFDLGGGAWTTTLALERTHIDWYEDDPAGHRVNWRDDFQTVVRLISEMPLRADLSAIGGVGHTSFNSDLDDPDIDYVNWEVYVGLVHEF